MRLGWTLKKEYYYNDETAVKDDTVYGGYKADWDRKQYYKSAVMKNYHQFY
ncbi:MAG: hypothetical protein ACLT9W_04400 [Streptococcus sp.]